MLKILSTQQIKALDSYTIEHEPIASIDLMERACRAFTEWFIRHIDATQKIGVVCGTGNNGGDGLGIARMLAGNGYSVKVWIVRGGVSASADFAENLKRLQGKVMTTEIMTAPEEGLFDESSVLIDAIFGSGLSRPAEGIYAQVIDRINEANALRVAVDIPSGLAADRASSGPIVKAHYTITFQLPKLAFLLPQSHPFTGEWVTVDIGLSKAFIDQAETSYRYITADYISQLLKPRKKFDHKGVFGHALLVVGSYGKIGAAVLASRAALRSGVGLLTVHIPQCGYPILQTAVPEAMTVADGDPHKFTKPGDTAAYSAIGIGPGLGQDKATVKAMESLLSHYRKPVVIDADGLNILSAHRELLHLVPPGSILSPHPKEFERLVGKWKDDFERLEKQQDLATRLRSVVIVKGAYSAIAAPDGTMFFNSSGNPGMATGGTGDVLTGILTSFLAQHYSPIDAAIAAVYLHGLAGDLAAMEKGEAGLIASDLIELLPAAIRKALNKR